MASGGGHLRQLLLLLPYFVDDDYFIVSERTPLSESAAQEHPVKFVSYFHFGMRRVEGTFKFLTSGLGNLLSSIGVFIRYRPDVIISTGSGSAYVTLLLGKLFHRKVVYIESIARVDQVSLFGRMASRYAGLVIAQWPRLVDSLPQSIYCDPIQVENIREDGAKGQVFVTIGTGPLFDRLLGAVNTLARSKFFEGRVIAQIGATAVKYDALETFEACSAEEMDTYFKSSDLVICHGGSGSLLGALGAGCRVVAMARDPQRGEVYDDHQKQIVGELAERGLIEVAENEDDLADAIDRARVLPRRRLIINPQALVSEIRSFIAR